MQYVLLRICESHSQPYYQSQLMDICKSPRNHHPLQEGDGYHHGHGNLMDSMKLRLVQQTCMKVQMRQWLGESIIIS